MDIYIYVGIGKEQVQSLKKYNPESEFRRNKSAPKEQNIQLNLLTDISNLKYVT